MEHIPPQMITGAGKGPFARNGRTILSYESAMPSHKLERTMAAALKDRLLAVVAKVFF